MLKKSIQLGIVLFFIGSSSFAQWSGAGTNDITSPIYRDGSVGIGNGSTNVFRKLTIGVTEPNDGIWLSSNGQKDIQLSVNCTQAAFNSLTQAGDHLLVWKTQNIDDANAGGLVIGPWSTSEKGLRITPDGKVGIGTSNPGSFKLAVEGRIGAREVQVTLSNPFPDYVFASNYKLRSLTNLENFINKNKHLPGIPSAAEVEKNGGVELGQMHTKLLEKVEELTLYVIELNKKVQKLEKENEALKKRN